MTPNSKAVNLTALLALLPGVGKSTALLSDVSPTVIILVPSFFQPYPRWRTAQVLPPSGSHEFRRQPIVTGNQIGQIHGGKLSLANNDVAVDDRIRSRHWLPEKQGGYRIVQSSRKRYVIHVQHRRVGRFSHRDLADL